MKIVLLIVTILTGLQKKSILLRKIYLIYNVKSLLRLPDYFRRLVTNRLITVVTFSFYVYQRSNNGIITLIT